MNWYSFKYSSPDGGMCYVIKASSLEDAWTKLAKTTNVSMHRREWEVKELLNDVNYI